MRHPRERLAELIVGYSLDLRPGQIVRIDGSDSGAPLVLALYEAALSAGALAYTNVTLEGLSELLVKRGSAEQLTYVAPLEWDEIELVDAMVTVWSELNTRSFSLVDPDRQQRHLAARRELSNRYWDRIGAGEARWCGTLHPTHAHAQDAEMSLADYEDFVYGACHVRDGEDPVAHWSGVSAELQARADALADVRELRIVGPDTDLTLGVEGRRWLVADGKTNLPDGEIFTSPVEGATEGEIRFTFPAIFNGREVQDVRLRFEAGRVVSSEASIGEDYLKALLAMDDEAAVLGEAAFGLNYEIDRFTRNILFDEKIGGTIHVALGAGFPEAGGRNRSGLHWDLICDLRAEGEVYADGELVWRAGSFVNAAEPVPETIVART
ncbi:MAG: aminopeptidase [Gaiellaceae bacterium]